MASIPKTMSGILIEKPGGVEVLQWKTDLPVLELTEGEVLVKNEFIGVNYIDNYKRTGLYPTPLPTVIGHEGAGTIVAAHPSVTAAYAQPGMRVGYIDPGSYAELTAVPAARIIPLPDDITTRQAAAVLLQGLTALTFVREAAGISSEPASTVAADGPWVLVHAAAGGTGLMLVQILSTLGARVIGTASTPEKCALAQGRGARWTLNSREDVLAARVGEITGGHGVDVIFDGVGQATFDLDLEIISRKGTLISFGNASGLVPPVNLLQLGRKNVRLLRPVLNVYMVTREEIETYSKELFEMIRSGKIEILVHKEYPLENVGQAHSDLEGRKTTGKLVLKV